MIKPQIGADNRTPDDVILRVSELRTEFLMGRRTVEAVRGVSFEVHQGEKIGIVGESGCGKSTLALSVMGLIPHPGRIVAGQVWLGGKELTKLSEQEMQAVRGKNVSLIFQDPMTSLDPVMRVGDQIVEVIRKHQRGVSRGEAQAQAIRLLQDVELPLAEERVRDYPHQLSGGMRQRVMIAIALANDPDLLIADEPTTALDVTTQAQVLDVLQRLVERHGTAVMLITHNLGIVAQFCDRVNVMYAGRLVEKGPTDSILTTPNHPYTEALLKSLPNPKRLKRGMLPTIPGSPPSLTDLPPGCSFEPRCPIGQGVEICRSKPPPLVSLGSSARDVITECHLAEEHWRELQGDD